MIKNFKLKIKNCPWGFTLVELMIVIAIVAMLMIAMVSIFNSMGILNKARDAQRKKDLSRMKVAFEEYFNDKGCYPDENLVNTLNLRSSCHKNIFAPWLSTWPCDPNGGAYQVVVEDIRFSPCNKWYKILTKLENINDKDIPESWGTVDSYIIGGEISSKSVNYGVASENINWYSVAVNAECAMYGGCYYKPDLQDQPNLCNSAGSGCVGPNCYLGGCLDGCQVACCGVGCN